MMARIRITIVLCSLLCNCEETTGERARKVTKITYVKKQLKCLVRVGVIKKMMVMLISRDKGRNQV